MFSERAYWDIQQNFQLGSISVTPYILPSTTMDPPGSDFTVSQLLFALKWKLDLQQTMEAVDTK